MDFFRKWGGGSEANPKVLGHFLCTNILELLVEKGGGWPNPKVFGHFLPKYWVNFVKN